MDGGCDDIEVVRAAVRIIVSYDVRRGQKTENAMIHQYLFGRRVTVRLASGKSRRYRYRGLMESTDVEHIGQSVLMMRQEHAEKFTAFLNKLNVPFTIWSVWCRP